MKLKNLKSKDQVPLLLTLIPRTVPILLPILLLLFSSYVFGEEMGNQSVVTEVYVPKVIIEGKWGTGQGEFGRGTIPFTEDYDDLIPESLAVDSKGNIYILDTANNRIQKFDNNGKYIKSISVPTWKGYREKGEILVPSEAIGINVVIDDEDNLYYYFIKNKYKSKEKMDKNGDGKVNYKDLGKIIPGSPGIYGEPDHSLFNNPNPKGEVWKFKDDVLVKKWEVAISGQPSVDSTYHIEIKDEKLGVIGKIVSDYMGGTIFEPEKDYVIEKQKIAKDKDKVIIRFKDGRKMEKEFNPFRKMLNNERFAIGKPFVIDKGNKVLINRSIAKYEKGLPYSTEFEIYMDIYDLKGNLINIIKGESSGEFDAKGNRYNMEITSTGIKVIKFERELINKK